MIQISISQSNTEKKFVLKITSQDQNTCIKILKLWEERLAPPASWEDSKKYFYFDASAPFDTGSTPKSQQVSQMSNKAFKTWKGQPLFCEKTFSSPKEGIDDLQFVLNTLKENFENLTFVANLASKIMTPWFS